MSDNNDASKGSAGAVEFPTCFSNTDVPRKALFDHLASGGPLDSFLSLHPTVTRERAETILMMAQIKQDELAKANGKTGPVCDLYSAYLAALEDDLMDEEELKQLMAGPFFSISDLLAELEAEVQKKGSSPKRVGKTRSGLGLSWPFFQGFRHFLGRGNLA